MYIWYVTIKHTIMEAVKNINTLTRRNRYLLALSLVFLLVFVMSLVLHLTPLSLIGSTVDFAAHHYYITSFVALVGLLFCIRNYIGNNSKINYLKRKIEQARKVMAFSQAYKRNTVQIKSIKPFNKAQSILVDKHQLNALEYSEFDVLTEKEAQLRRDFDLQYCMKLGNNYKLKVTIYFADKDSIKHVHTTIWHTSSSHVLLKGDISLPVRAIYKVEY